MKQFLVLGCGRFGSSIAKTLYKLGHDVMVIDKDSEKIKNISQHVTHVIEGDAKDEKIIRSLGVSNFDIVVVTMALNIQSSILTSILLRELGAKYIIAKAQNELHAKVLYKIGVDRVVFPEKDMGAKVARNIISPNIVDYINLSSDYSIVEISPLKQWFGKSLIELNLRRKYEINVIAVKQGDDINISPRADYVVNKGDILVVISHNSNSKKLMKLVNK
ncbi:MAG: TrkA family potassium uptake protein [Firmicutes bacterium]|nr:TrkA family potassium uptake protein [Bacillota bacterium]